MTYPDQPTQVAEVVVWDTAARVLADLANRECEHCKNGIPLHEDGCHYDSHKNRFWCRRPTVADIAAAARQYPITDAECRRVVELITEAMEGRAS